MLNLNITKVKDKQLNRHNTEIQGTTLIYIEYLLFILLINQQIR